jgi:hypothetical protein
MTLSERIELIEKAMGGATPGRWGQFHPTYAPEAVGTPFSTWDSSHDLSAIKDGKKIGRIATFKHSADAAYVDACNPAAISELLSAARKAEALEREVAEKDARIAALEAGVSDLVEIARQGVPSIPPDGPINPEHQAAYEATGFTLVEIRNRARTLLNGGSDAIDE